MNTSIVTCRICMGDENDGELIAPCHCKGTMKFIHRECLDLWRIQGMKLTQIDKCEVCKFVYKKELVGKPYDIKLDIFFRVLVILFVVLFSICVFGFVGKWCWFKVVGENLEPTPKYAIYENEAILEEELQEVIPRPVVVSRYEWWEDHLIKGLITTLFFIGVGSCFVELYYWIKGEDKNQRRIRRRQMYHDNNNNNNNNNRPDNNGNDNENQNQNYGHDYGGTHHNFFFFPRFFGRSGVPSGGSGGPPGGGGSSASSGGGVRGDKDCVKIILVLFILFFVVIGLVVSVYLTSKTVRRLYRMYTEEMKARHVKSYRIIDLSVLPNIM